MVQERRVSGVMGYPWRWVSAARVRQDKVTMTNPHADGDLPSWEAVDGVIGPGLSGKQAVEQEAQRGTPLHRHLL
jgi:hypothetical protein